MCWSLHWLVWQGDCKAASSARHLLKLIAHPRLPNHTQRLDTHHSSLLPQKRLPRNHLHHRDNKRSNQQTSHYTLMHSYNVDRKGTVACNLVHVRAIACLYHQREKRLENACRSIKLCLQNFHHICPHIVTMMIAQNITEKHKNHRKITATNSKQQL